MPNVTVDLSQGVAVVTPLGEITLSRVKRLIPLVLEHPDFVRGMPTLWDYRDADLSPLSSEDFRQLQTFMSGLREVRGEARVAFVNTKPHLFGMTRMYEVLGEVTHLDYRSFYDFDEAMEWCLEALG